MNVAIAWAAGLFDGEGCISIGYVRPSRRNDIVNPSYRLTIKVTMGCEASVKAFGAIVEDGTFQTHVTETERANSSYSWVAMSRKAENILIKLRPYLLTKASEADVALEFMALPDGRSGGKGGCKPADAALMQKKHDLYIRCCQLKSRWRFRKEKPAASPEPARKKKR